MRKVLVIVLLLVAGSLSTISPTVAHERSNESAVSTNVIVLNEATEEPPRGDRIFSDAEVQAFARARGSVGLNDDLGVVQALALDPAAITRGAQLGFPITELEQSELATRLDVQQGSASVLAAARDLSPETYSGGWLDLANGTINVAYTDFDVDDHRLEALRAAARRPDAVRIHRFRFTEAQLAETTDLAFSARAELAAQGLAVQGSMQLEQSNSVLVFIEDPASDATQRLASAMEVDPAMLRVEPYTGEVAAGAPLGGHALRPTSGSGWCSSGAFGYVTGPFGTFPYLVTAGHCPNLMKHTNGGGPGGGLHNPAFSTNTETDYGSVDAQKMDIGGVPPYAVTTLVEGWGTGDFRLVSAAGYHGDFDINGAMVCHAGATTQGAGNCATINSNNFNCGSHWDMRRTTVVTCSFSRV